MRTLLHILTVLSLMVAAQSAIAQNPNTNFCGLKLEATAIGKHLVGSLRQTSGAICTNGTFKWYDTKTQTLLQEGPVLDYTLPDYGEYTIKVVFQVDLPGNQMSCAGELSQKLKLTEPSCMQLFSATSSVLSSDVNSSVCGCNGINYQNEFEARAAGASSWWAGDCTAQPSVSDCGFTDLGVNVYAGNPTDGYWVQFTNLASGNFTHIQLDYGDNCQLFQAAQWTTRNHHYTKGGIYKVTITAWNINQPGCVSSYSKIFATDAVSQENATLPVNLDYVLPGDANGDGKANAYDILQVSRGYGKNGSPRPEASNDWALQYAPNWPQLTNNGINYKHIDANGDGFINEFDTEPLELNYQPIALTAPQTYKDGAPKIYTKFAEDTVTIDLAHPELLEINADIMIGSPDQPVTDLYGVACALRYPDFVAHDAAMYYDPSFFGSSNYVLSLGRDNHDVLQYDLGFARKTGAGATGYGRLAKLTFHADFIIIIDIIDRAEKAAVPFVLPVDGIQAVDSAGNIITLSQTAVPDTLWIKSIGEVSKVKDVLVNNEVRLFPNPATDFIDLQTGHLTVESVEVINTLGQVVYQSVANGTKTSTRIDVAQWQTGIYTVRIKAKEGVAEKQFIVK